MPAGGPRTFTELVFATPPTHRVGDCVSLPSEKLKKLHQNPQRNRQKRKLRLAMNEQQIAQFISITNASRGAALRCLDAAGGNLEDAVENFFNGASSSAAAPMPSRNPASSNRVRSNTGGGIRSLSDLARKSNVGVLNDDEGDDDDGDYNDYYAGGEKSGQLVRGAPERRGDGSNRIDEVFDQARRSGAVEGRPADLMPQTHKSSFQGRGRTLAGGQQVEEAPATGASAEQEQTRTVTFYSNGVFTVDGDDEPRRLDDPRNMAFVAAISRGQLPPELEPGDPSIHVTINLVRHDGEYTPPPQPRFKAFAGSGHKLGGDTSNEKPSTLDETPTQKEAEEKGDLASWQNPDDSLPKTTIQLRLADGSRMVAEFNLQQTVGDIRRFIRLRQGNSAPFTLSTAFPPKPLMGEDVTIAEAGLANSVVIQKWT